jgi:aryl-alcohol dehydrogenase-like predicted oxidoreductase
VTVVPAGEHVVFANVPCDSYGNRVTITVEADMHLTRRDGLFGAAAFAVAGGLPRAAQAQAPALVQKPIPSSGEMLPVIGLGTARRYESAGTPAERDALKATLARFSQLGLRIVDSAPSYGQAEAIVGELLSELGTRSSVFLCTKVGVDNREQGVAQIEASFRRMRTERIDMLAVHNLRDITNQLAILRDLKQAGRVRYVGATTSFERQYADFEAMMRREQLDWIQVDYALDNRATAERIIPLARDRGVAVMINLPFGRGRLFNATQGRRLPEWAAEFDCTSWAQFFLKYLVSHEAVTAAAPGMAQARYVDDNAKAAQGRLPDAAMRRRMEQFIDSV